MPKRIGPYYEVKLYDRHLQYGRVGGFGRKDTMAQVHDSRAAIIPYFIPSHYSNLGCYGSQPVAAVHLTKVGEHGVAVPKALCDMGQAASLGSSYYETFGGTWTVLTGSQYGEQIMYQYDGANAVTGLKTTWYYPPNPVICVSLWRGETSGSAGSNHAQYTAIYFGRNYEGGPGGQFRLVIPYGGWGPWMSFWNQWTSRWEPLEPVDANITGLPPVEGIQEGQRLFVWIACWRGEIWASTDGFQSVAQGWMIPEGAYDSAGIWHSFAVKRHVYSGPVSIEHTVGQWAATVYPIWMPNSTDGITPTIQSQPYEFGYKVADNPNAVNVQTASWPVRADPEGSETEGEILADVSVSVVDLGDTQRAWKVTLEPYRWEHGGVTTYVAPQLLAAQIWQAAHVYSYETVPTPTTVSDVVEVELTWPGTFRPATGRIVFENSERTFSSLKDYQRVQIKLGSKLDDGSNDGDLVFAGWIVTPGRRARTRGPRAAEAYVFDALARLEDIKVLLDSPDFGWSTGDGAFTWILGHCGFHSNQISGSGSGDMLIEDYDPEDDRYLPEFGRPWLDVVRQILHADGQSELYVDYDATEFEILTRTNGPFSSTSVDYQLQEKTPPDESSSIYHIYSIRVDRDTASVDRYANWVVVEGASKPWRRVAAMAWDENMFNSSADTFAGGWPHTYAERDMGIQTMSDAMGRAYGIYEERAGLAEYCTVETDLIAGVRYGQVFSTTSTRADGRLAEVGALDKKWRIIAYKHRVAKGRQARTELTGKYIGTV